MINRYFGICGSGKTTHLVATALKENHKINKGKSRYKRILTNVPITGINEKSNIYLFDGLDFGVYDMSNSLILYDESEVDFDSRSFKNLGHARTNFLMKHRHYKTNIYFYSQTYDGVDKKIRFLTSNVYYIKRNILTGKSTPHRIKYSMYIPKKPKRDEIQQFANDGEITMRYFRTGFWEHLFSKLFLEPPIVLRKYYRNFDSYIVEPLPLKDFPLCV